MLLVDPLFSEADMHALIERLRLKVRQDIDSLPEEVVLNTSGTDLVEHFVTKYHLEVPQLHEDGIYVEDRGEVKIDVSGDRSATLHPVEAGRTTSRAAASQSLSPSLAIASCFATGRISTG